jgi:PTH1 family peptidyl-tRNA hydrolase
MEQLVIVGLGNPGHQYDGSRHNLGIRAVRQWIKALLENQRVPEQVWQMKKEVPAEVISSSVADRKMTCLFPLTYMNQSGLAVAAFLRDQSLGPERLVVVHDDVELPLGTVRVKMAGSAAGHKGVRSIIESLGTADFARIRIGVDRPAGDIPLDQYVLAPLTVAEDEALQPALRAVAQLLTAVSERGRAGLVPG